MPNGNTILCNWGGHDHVGKQEQIAQTALAKKVVWQVFHNEKLTASLHIHLLGVKGGPATGKLVR